MNDHERARLLIAMEGSESPRAEDQAWLRTHLHECASCRAFADSAASTIRALRSEPLPTTDSALIRTIQKRVQARTRELTESRARTRVIWITSVLVGLASVPTTSLSWRSFPWIGTWAVSLTPSQVGTTLLCIIPALVAAGFLLTRDVDLTDRN